MCSSGRSHKKPIRTSVDRDLDKSMQAPIMPLDKPYLTEIDLDNYKLSWIPAILPPRSKPTPIK